MMTDDEIEALFKRCGGRWHEADGQWIIEDADLHPLVRTIESAAPPPDHIEQALADAIAAPPIAWPQSKDVGRAEDMGEGYLRVLLDSDNDACVQVWDGDRSASVEFCNGGGGGGRSMRTRMALVALMVAIEADNAERPDLARGPGAI